MNGIKVKVKQMYKDKTILMGATTKYKIKHNFNFELKDLTEKGL